MQYIIILSPVREVIMWTEAIISSSFFAGVSVSPEKGFALIPSTSRAGFL